MKRSIFFLLFFSGLCGLALCAQDIPAELKGNLVVRDGEKTKPADEAKLEGTRYFGLYFSAGWCGPCRMFTPSLVRFYNEMKPKHPEFEIVLISGDRSESAMERYMADMEMPWPALKFEQVRQKPELLKYVCAGIPCLVLVNEKGEVLSHTMVEQEYLGPGKVVEDLEKLLVSSKASPAPSAPAPSPMGSAPAASPGAR